ncbi:hypothetical protein HMPREF0980_00708 [Dorea sp. D27]|nr:hypothetical protein HMPREF0980_00708 [Dorea sp. D27]
MTAGAFVLKKYNAGLSYTYTESRDMVENPYQGSYFQWSTKDAEGIYDVISRNPGCRLVLLTYNLDDERDRKAIREDKLKELSRALNIAEDLGLSVIFRGAYDFAGEYKDPEFEIMLAHIRQTGTVLNMHKSCLAGVQAGMIGAFGEWTQSRYMEEKKYRMEVVEAWMEVLDPVVPISVRRQKFIREAEEWGLETDRIGVYNDGLFSSDSDLGTYREDYDRKDDLAWTSKNMKVPFNGGEMPFVSEFTQIDNVVKEARQLNLSYLNQEYNHEVWELWEKQRYEGMAGDEYVKMYLGCRPWVKTVKTDRHLQQRDTVSIKIDLRNSGFAMMSPEYHVYVVLKCGGKTARAEAEGAMENKERGTFSVKASNPFAGADAEKYGISVGIQISRDKEDEIEESYCLRLANKGTIYEDGVNYLLTQR